jgi:hypothetical protein
VADVIIHVFNFSWIQEAILMIVNPHVGDFLAPFRGFSARRLWPGLAGMAARRNLVIEIEVCCAARVFVTAIRSSMTGSHVRSTLFSHVLITLTPQVLTPDCVEVDFWAEQVALLVHVLAVLAVAVLRAALCKQFVLGGLGQQDIHIAFDLLSCRPINLAILLEALLGFVDLMVVSLAPFPASVVDVIACQVVASLVLAVGGLALCLLAIAFCVELHISFVGDSALVVQLHPLTVCSFKLGDLLGEPRTEVTIHFKTSNL